MNQDINTHLEKLKNELEKLEPAVKHLQKADENATALITAMNNIHKEFTKHLQNIEKTLADSNEKHQKQLAKEIQDSTKKINDASDKLIKSNLDFENQIKTLLTEHKRLVNAISNLIEKIEKVDFPSRLDKIDTTISSINYGLQNIQGRIGDIERNLKDYIRSVAKELYSKVETTESSLIQKLEYNENSITNQFKNLYQKNKIIKILLFISIALIVFLIGFQFLKS